MNIPIKTNVASEWITEWLSACLVPYFPGLNRIKGSRKQNVTKQQEVGEETIIALFAAHEQALYYRTISSYSNIFSAIKPGAPWKASILI